MSKRNITILLGVVAIIAIGAFLATRPSPVVTNNNEVPTPIEEEVYEKKYESENIKISFNYPSNLFIEESPDRVGVTSIPPGDPRRQSSAMMGALVISFIPNQTLEKSIVDFEPVTLSIKDSMVDGYPAKEITSKPDGYSGSTWIYLVVESDNGVFEIIYLRDTEQAPIYQSIINSINFI